MAKISVDIRAPFQYDAQEVSKKTAVKFTQPSKTQQHEKEAADINNIVKRFNLTGQLPENLRVPKFGDFRGIKDYQSALNAVQLANESFQQLPAEIRKRFNHDPEQFVEFCLDKKNVEEMKQLGLLPEDKRPQEVAQGTPEQPPVEPPKAERKAP